MANIDKDRAQQIFDEQATSNWWLTQLTDAEKAHIVDMINSALWEGFNEGAIRAQNEAAKEIHEHYQPKHY